LTILDAMQDEQLFKPWFRGLSWSAWISFLKALFALPLDENDLITYQRHSTRHTAPQEPFREAWVVVGRRGGKSLVAAAVAVYLACFRDYSACLQPGEVGTVALIAADRRQARTLLRYVRGFLDLPMLNGMIKRETQDAIELHVNGCVIAIEVHTASFRTTRGYTLLAVICDEIAFWRNDETTSNADREIVAAVRPGLASIPDSLLLCISSPYARRGALWSTYSRHFGRDDSNIFVWQADSRSMNPNLPQSVIEQAYEEDPESARAEYGAEFRSDLETFVSPEAVTACTVRGRLELPPAGRLSYKAFVDPAGGSGGDSMTLGIAHEHRREGASKYVVDCIRERHSPFSPDDCVQEFSDVLKSYKISNVIGDRYAGEWPREAFRRHSIEYEPCSESKSELYLNVLPLLNSSRVELVDSPRLISQLLNLERKTARGGRDSVDHPPNGHDDVINSVVGALYAVALKSVGVEYYGIF
jgi:hypothetical protein